MSEGAQDADKSKKPGEIAEIVGGLMLALGLIVGLSSSSPLRWALVGVAIFVLILAQLYHIRHALENHR